MTEKVKSFQIPLDKNMREAFVNSVCEAIKTDYDIDGLRKQVIAEAVKALPAAVQAVYADSSTHHYVAVQSVRFETVYRAKNTGMTTKYVYCGGFAVPGVDYKPSAKLKELARKMMQESADKLDAKDAMHEKLTAMVRTCRNTGDLEEMFPTLIEHIPAKARKVPAGVPAVLVRDTVQELRKLGVPAPKAKA